MDHNFKSIFFTLFFFSGFCYGMEAPAPSKLELIASHEEGMLDFGNLGLMFHKKEALLFYQALRSDLMSFENSPDAVALVKAGKSKGVKVKIPALMAAFNSYTDGIVESVNDLHLKEKSVQMQELEQLKAQMQEVEELKNRCFKILDIVQARDEDIKREKAVALQLWGQKEVEIRMYREKIKSLLDEMQLQKQQLLELRQKQSSHSVSDSSTQLSDSGKTEADLRKQVSLLTAEKLAIIREKETLAKEKDQYRNAIKLSCVLFIAAGIASTLAYLYS